ncbi:glycosyltransferase family 2 protein [Catenulispora rubra]|uniref:glycosyltransferase family 2 protein n=1 Tax=Catenulispora rubra TaxID=280293 RepID=UPI00189251E5|nr:glycosyltransferase family A protein [Catenulispora rubra]
MNAGAAPRVSVLIPVAPRQRHLEETLLSIQKQTFQDWEVVLVLDGDCEANRRMAAVLPADRIRIVLTRSPRSGPAAARNTGLPECRGDLVAFCDGDDLCDPERLARQVAEFDRRPTLGMLATWARRFDSDTGADLGPLRCPAEYGALARRLLLFNTVTMSTVMARPEVLREAGDFREAAVHCEDYDLWLRILGRAEMGGLTEELVRYRVHRGQFSHRAKILPQSGLLRREKLAAARRLEWSVTVTWIKHLAWVGVQVANRRF